MKTTTAWLVLGLLAGCSPPADDPNAAVPATTDSATPSATTETPTTPPADTTASTTASATGVVESVDPAANTITIAHGPVAALEWPAMTMTFQAPGVDLSTIKQGDQVSFEFAADGMDGTITKIARQ